MRKIITIASSIFVLLAAPQMLFAQATGTLTGTVRSENAGPLPGATVSVRSAVPRVAITDFEGHYRIMVEPGTFSVQVSMPGRSSSTQEISVAAGGTVSVDFMLMDAVAPVIENPDVVKAAAPLIPKPDSVVKVRPPRPDTVAARPPKPPKPPRLPKKPGE